MVASAGHGFPGLTTFLLIARLFYTGPRRGGDPARSRNSK